MNQEYQDEAERFFRQMQQGLDKTKGSVVRPNDQPLVQSQTVQFEAKIRPSSRVELQQPKPKCPFCENLFIKYVNVNCITDDSWDIYFVDQDDVEHLIGTVGGTGGTDPCYDGPPPGTQVINIPDGTIKISDVILPPYEGDDSESVCALHFRAKFNTASGDCGTRFALLVGSNDTGKCGLTTYIMGGSGSPPQDIYVSIMDVCDPDGGTCDPPLEDHCLEP